MTAEDARNGVPMLNLFPQTDAEITPPEKIVTKFLNIDLEYAGWLPESKTIAGSIVSRKPAILKKSLEPVLSKNFSDIASYMANVKVTKTGGIKFFNK